MRNQMVETRHPLCHRGTMRGGDPPQHQGCLDGREPLFAARIKTLVQGLPYETLERLHIFPHCQVRQNGRIVIDPHVHGVAARVLQAPDKARNIVGKTIHPSDVVDEFAHPRIIERIADPRDVELGEMAAAVCHAADSSGAQRAVFQSCADTAAQSNAWSLGPCRLRCSSRATASSTLGRCPAGTHHMTKYCSSKCSNHSVRRL